MSKTEHSHCQHASHAMRRPIPEFQLVSLAPHITLEARPQNKQEAHIFRENRLYACNNFKKTSA